MEVKQGRLCNSTATPLVRQGPSEAPSIGNKNTANVLLSNDEMFGGLEKWVKWPGADWKDIEGKVEYRA